MNFRERVKSAYVLREVATDDLPRDDVEVTGQALSCCGSATPLPLGSEPG